ncbi:MAG: hypothetical protein ACOC0F_03145 [archaeon]
MNGKTLATLSVVALVLLAGCGALGGNGSTPTATDATGGDGPTTIPGGDSLGLTEPAWLSDMPDASGTYRNDGTVYVVEYASGPTIPEGTALTIKGGYSTLGTATISESVEPGETVYVYATGGPNENTTVHVSVGTEPDVPSDAMQLAGNQAVLSATVGDLQFSVGPNRSETEN